MTQSEMKAISLFSGMGGDSVGIKNAGINLVAYSEKEKKFRESHDLNFHLQDSLQCVHKNIFDLTGLYQMAQYQIAHH